MRSSFVALADADRESAADLGSARMPSLPPLPRASASSLAAALAASAAARGGAEVLRREDLERLPTASEPDAERRVPPAQRRPRTGDRFAAGGRFDDGFDSARAVPVDKGAEPAALFALGAVGASQSLSLAAPDLHLSMLPLPPRPTRREVDDEEKRGSDDRFPVVQRQEHSQQHDREDQLVGTRAVKDAEEKVESPPNGAAALGEVAAAGGLELVLLSVADPQPRHAAPLARVSVAEISCGGRHWAAVTDDGGLWMWGDNECGQLGCGDREPRAEPVFISTLRGVATAACGVRHTLACTRAGELFSWGSAANGCLGLSARSVEPQDPAVSAAAAVAVAASGEVAKVGVDADGEVEAYEEDANHEAQASAADANVPQRVEALAGMHVAGVACGAANSAAITVGEAAASLWLWGAGACGQIGDGAGRARRAPKRVELDVSGGGVAQVSLGARHAAAVLADGRLFVWGDNSMGQLGLALEGGRTCSLAPLPLPLGDGELAAQAACGDAHTSALTRAGNLWSWGSGATKQLGVEQPAQLAGPTLIAGFPGLRQVCVGSEMTAAVTAAGDLFLWGAPIQSATPLRVDTLADVSVAAACVAVRGAFAALYCAAAGAVLVEWGGAQVSQLRVEQMAPLRGRRLRAVARGAEHSVAVTESGSVLTWGGNANGQLGTGEGVAAAPLPRSVALIEPVVEVACGRDHTLALSVSGTLFAWGCGSLGRLGLRSEADSSRPKLVDALANVKLCGVACSAFNSAAVAIDGRLFVWGAGRAGQLGGGVATSPALEPMHVANLGRAVARVALGDEHVAAIDTAGSLLTWGSNARGQLGRPDAGGGDEQIAAPGEVVVPEDEPVTDVRCCGLATLALSDGGSVLGCGAAELNVLALHPPPADDARTLAPVAALAAARCSAIAAGAGAFAAVGTGGEVFVWGSDLHAPVRIDEALGDAAAVKGIALGVGHAILFADRLP
jgi:alpha-tubulin suppressor-like RCC1 family protein